MKSASSTFTSARDFVVHGMIQKKEDGTVIFYQENLETGTYEVEASGKYTVRVTADDHKGGFYIGE